MSVPAPLVREAFRRGRRALSRQIYQPRRRYPAISVRVAEPVAKWYSRYYGSALVASGLMSLGEFSQNVLPLADLQPLDFLPEYSVETGAEPSPMALRLPMYGAPRLPIPSVTVDVPGHIGFEWENQEDTPVILPQVSLEPSRRHTGLVERLQSRKMPVPATVMVYKPPSQREPNRRRQDQKVPGFYSRALALVNRTYGPVSEYLEVLHAFQQNPSDLDALVTALALNQAYDYQVGRQQRFLKETVYRSGYWPFPVGYSALSRLWRG